MLLRRRRGPGLVRMAATTAVVAGTAGAVSHHQQQKYANQAEAQQAEAQAAEPQAAPAAAEDPTMAELQRLATLHTSGVLTDEEFTAAKAKILGI
jgi:membrane protease subunit (stomatin/prohibitin family)